MGCWIDDHQTQVVAAVPGNPQTPLVWKPKENVSGEGGESKRLQLMQGDVTSE